ncbi:MAG: protein phosphatase CheZ [Thermodesulfobacteriota bacterium]
MEKNLPVLNLELSSGTFRINTPEAVYQITVKPESSLSRVVEKVVERETTRPAPAAEALVVPDLFYQELTQEMYSEIGRLARQLSLSIKEIPGKEFKGVDIESAGIELEDAKGQLEDIVQMTEKATMDIMDRAESIQEELQKVERQLSSLLQMDFMTGLDEDLSWDEGDEGFSPAGEEPAKSAAGTPPEFFTRLLEMANRLQEAVGTLPELSDQGIPAPAAAQPVPEFRTEKKKEYHFNPDVVFQTLYELCTNETVKDHIKSMRADQSSAFNLGAVSQGLSDLAPNVSAEDNFFNFPIAAILKLLFQATNNDKYRQILKKMNQTIGNIFLDSILPVEGLVQEQETTLEAPAPPTAPVPTRPGLPSERIGEMTGLIEEAIKALQAEKERVEAALQEEDAALIDGSREADFTRVKNEDRKTMISSVEGASDVVKLIMGHITRILESLAFQDLSGQRILKIVRLISDVQVQLLSLLVSFGSKIKRKKEEPTLTETPEDTHRLVQDEVDKMIERITGPSKLEGPEAEGRLDQGAVDNLLADLGF